MPGEGLNYVMLSTIPAARTGLPTVMHGFIHIIHKKSLPKIKHTFCTEMIKKPESRWGRLKKSRLITNKINRQFVKTLQKVY